RAGAEILPALADTNRQVAASAAGVAGASGDSTLAAHLVRLYRANPDPREPDVSLAVLDAFSALGAGAARGSANATGAKGAADGGESPVRGVIEDGLRSPDRRIREGAGRAMAAVFGEAAAARARTEIQPPAWKGAPLDAYRAMTLEERAGG